MAEPGLPATHSDVTPHPSAASQLQAEYTAGERSFARRNLAGADLRGANLKGGVFVGADFTGADLSGADLSRANLAYASLRGANLRRINLRGANLDGADLANADLTAAMTDPPMQFAAQTSSRQSTQPSSVSMERVEPFAPSYADTHSETSPRAGINLVKPTSASTVPATTSQWMEPSSRKPSLASTHATTRVDTLAGRRAARPVRRTTPHDGGTLALALAAILFEGGWNLIRNLALIIGGILILGTIIGHLGVGLSEHSSCQDYEQADSGAQTKVLQDMMAAHGTPADELQGTRVSVELYCAVYGGSAPIDGIYSGGKTGSPMLAVRERE